MKRIILVYGSIAGVSEIAPVAIIMTLISAALLRKRDFMPARVG